MLSSPEDLPSALSAERHELDVGGHAVSFYVGGPGSTNQPPLLLIHSINAAASAYEVKPLYDHYRDIRPVYAIDLPGYGHSDRSDRFYSPRVMTDAVQALADEIRSRHGGGAIDVIAVSLSCEYAARASVESPAAFRNVCLVSATGLNRERPFDAPPGTTRGKRWLLTALGRAPWSAVLFRLLTRPGVIRFFLEKTWGSKDIDEGLLAYDIATTRQRGASNAPFHFLSAYLFSADITRIYEQVPVPVLLIHGTRGDFVNYVGAERLRRRAGWSIRSMPTGALPYFEDLAGFVALHEDFLGPGS
jgi:pimeloyl-ACP methyl ester carboxylesterase